MKRRNKQKGNTLLNVVISGTVVLAGVTFVMQYLGQLNKNSITASRNSEGSNQDQFVLGLLGEKFLLKGVKQTPISGPAGSEIQATFYEDGLEGIPASGDQQPYLFVDPYPTLDELNNSNFKPTIELFKPDPLGAQPNPNLQTTNQPIRPISLPLILVGGKLNEQTRACEPLPNPITRFTNQVEALDCNIKRFRLDSSKLLSLESRNPSSASSSDFQSAFLVFPNLGTMSAEQAQSFFTQPSFTTPLESLDSKLVSFLGVFPDPNYPRLLKSLLVKSGATIALLDMPVPPEPDGSFELAAGQSEPLALGADVRVAVKTNSITVSGSYSGNSFFVSPTSLSLPRQSMSHVQKYGFYEQAVVNMTAPQNLYTDRAIYGPPQINPANDREGLWVIRGKVQGLKGRTQEFSKSLRVSPPPKPDCEVSFNSDRFQGGKELLQGETLTISLNCNKLTSGHVDSATIGGIPVTNFDNNPSSPNYKRGSVLYTRQNVTAAETITAVVMGPGGTWSDSTSLSLSAVCAYNDASYIGNFSNEFGVWPFGRTWQLYNNMYIIGPSGDWGGGHDAFEIANWGTYQTCDSSTGFCMYSWQAHASIYTYVPEICPKTCSYQYYDSLGQLQTTNYSCDYECGSNRWIDPATTDAFGNPLPLSFRLANVNVVGSTIWSYVPGGQGVWVDVGDKRDANCAPRKYAYRRYGCFTPETKITMADGKEKSVSDIAQNDQILNPLYQVPMRVVKIVKGPEKKPLYQVLVNGRKLTVTEGHPFLTQRGWVRADTLSKNDLLMGDGEPLKIKAVKKLAYKKPIEVYNFELDSEVSEAHLVKANGIPTGDLAIQARLKNPKSVP